MTSFSVFRQDTQPAGSLTLAPRQATAGRRPEAPAVESAVAWMPPRSSEVAVVLRLPNLHDIQVENPRVRWWSRVPYFWIAITLGALLALALASTGKQPTPRATEEAPAWTVPGVRAAEMVARVPSETRQAPVVQNEPAGQAPQIEAGAHGPVPPLDGKSQSVAPGEAAPLGISTVPQ